MSLKSIIRNLFREKTDDEKYEEGFHWGYNQVANGHMTPLEVEDRYDDLLKEQTPFDVGAKNGVNTAISVHGIEDNRILKGQ